eukprot:3647964-Karenia_brevis.AAC.1
MESEDQEEPWRSWDRNRLFVLASRRTQSAWRSWNENGEMLTPWEMLLILTKGRSKRYLLTNRG